MQLFCALALLCIACAPAAASRAAHSLQHVNHSINLAESCHLGSLYSRSCCKHATPSTPSPRRVKLTFFIATRNDNYGGNPSAARSAAAVAAVAWGLNQYNLVEDAELIIVDWNSQQPIRCTKYYQHALAMAPRVCKGENEKRTCAPDLVRIVEVPPAMAQRYAPSPVSEVHTFNIAVRKSRGDIILRIDQDTFTSAPFFAWLAWQKRHRWPDLGGTIWWASRDGVISVNEVQQNVLYDINHYFRRHQQEPCPVYDKPPPKRPPFDEDKTEVDFAFWKECINEAVGVWGYPVELMKDVRGMNELYVWWGDMEEELCYRWAAGAAAALAQASACATACAAVQL